MEIPNFASAETVLQEKMPKNTFVSESTAVGKQGGADVERWLPGLRLSRFLHLWRGEVQESNTGKKKWKAIANWSRYGGSPR